MLSRDVVAGIGQLLRQVLLGRYAVRLVVGVGVVLPMSEPLGARIVSIPQVARHQSDPAGVHVVQRSVDCLDHRVRLGRQGKRNNCLGQVDPPLGHADELVGSASPMSSEAKITSRRAMKRGSSPAATIRAR